MSAQVRNTRTRRVGTIAAAVALTGCALFAVSGCSAGQISQTASQAAAVNGAHAQAGDLALRDVYIKHTEPMPPKAELAFLISNASPTQTHELVSITNSDGAKATIKGNTTIAPNGFLLGNPPVGTLVDEKSPVDRLQVSIPVPDSLLPGLTTDLTFTFDDGKSVTFAVPLDAGAAAKHSAPASS